MSDRQTAEEIETAAAAWVWRLDQQVETPELKRELDAWLEGDTRRRGALLKARATWLMLDRAKVLSGLSPAQEAKPTAPSRRIMLAGGAAAAASAAAVGLGWRKRPRFDTEVGEIRRLPLADGSQVALNTASRVIIDLQPQRRTVTLARGEAWFHVAKDARRPFVVEAGPVRVRAVGTAFSVRRGAAGAEVLVTEGVVETWVVGAEGHTVRVAAGHAVTVSEDAAIVAEAGKALDIDRRLAWRDGKIDLRGQSLSDAVAEFNRYNGQKLVIGDPAIASAPLYGVFRTDDPAGFAGAVAASLNTSATTRPDGAISLGRRGLGG